MNRSNSILGASILSVALAVSVFAGCDQDTDGAPGGETSESTVCRQGGSDLCGDGCAPSYEKIELGPDCCACKPTICEGVACAPPQCGPGETVALPSDSCCPACVPEVSSCSDDDEFICTAFTCAEGYVATELGGGCCNYCAADETYCASEAEVYLAELEAWLTPEVTVCTQDSDCTYLPSSNPCKSACFGSAVNTASAEDLTEAVDDYAAANCSHCPTVNLACPAVAMMPTCDEGTCQ